jgi:hypothetical protein
MQLTPMPFRLCCGFAVVLFAGCAHRLQFRAVDDSSGVALSGAAVKIEERGWLTYFYRNRHIRQVGFTDTNGVIAVNGVKPKHSIYFEAAGYRPALVTLDENDQIKISWYLPPNNPFSDSPPRGPWTPSGLVVTNVEGVIAVPLTSTAK